MTARLPRSQLPCSQHVIVLGKGDLSSCCSYHSVGVWMWSVPHPRCLCRGHGHGVCPGRISLLSEPSSSSTSFLFLTPPPNFAIFLSLLLATMRWETVPYNVFPAMLFCLCLNPAAMEPVWWAKKKKKEKKILTLYWAVFCHRGKRLTKSEIKRFPFLALLS